jgi:predicted RNA binding protein YcfA (HicA-like mRNA interferase family)
MERISRGHTRNVDFADFQGLLESYGFKLGRVSGSHHFYARHGIAETLNIQPLKGEAKPYQLRQFLAIVTRYDLHPKDER